MAFDFFPTDPDSIERSGGDFLGVTKAGREAVGLGGGDENNPMYAASPYLRQLAPILRKYYDPYVAMGQRVMPQVEQSLQSQLTHPENLYQQLGKTYRSSPGYQFEVDEANKAAERAASAGGYLGTPKHQRISEELSSHLASRDYGNYMRQVLGLRSEGLRGMEGLNQMGYGASTGLAENLSRALLSQSNMAARGAAQDEASDQADTQAMMQMAALAAMVLL